MAGDWLKIEKSTPHKPEVYQIAAILNLDSDIVFAKLFRIWSWFDDHFTSCNAPSVTESLLDRCICVTGFANAMQQVGWLTISDDGCSLPNWDRHNGNSAKKRALSGERVKRFRNAPNVTNALPEKRREEKRIKEKQTTFVERNVGAASVRKPPTATLPDSVWIDSLKASPAYSGIDVEREHAKCVEYFSLKGITPSRKRFLNWLNRAERPLSGVRELTKDERQAKLIAEMERRFGKDGQGNG